MDFSPNDGFCCPIVERVPSTSVFEPVIAKFLAWVKSLPVCPDRPKRYGSSYASNVVALKDQPYVIKIVEEGYAFMFQGAFTPREGEGNAGEFDRIPYFDLITSDFQEVQLDSKASEVVVCDKHDKRFLLGLYMKNPRATDSWSKESGTAASARKVLEESCEVQENEKIPVKVTAPVACGKEDGDDRGSLVNTNLNEECHETHKPQKSSTSRQSDKDSWTWL